VGELLELLLQLGDLRAGAVEAGAEVVLLAGDLEQPAVDGVLVVAAAADDGEGAAGCHG
jgi:hypothetical protein